MRRPKSIYWSLFWIGLITLVRPWLGVITFAMLITCIHLAYRDGRRRYGREQALLEQAREEAA